MASVRRCQQLPLCLTDPKPPSSRMGPLLTKGESISDGGSAPGLTYLRRGKNCCSTAHAAGKKSESM